MAPTLLFNSTGYTETEISQVTTPNMNFNYQHLDVKNKEISFQLT